MQNSDAKELQFATQRKGLWQKCRGFFIAPNSYQDHKSESSKHYPNLASRAAGFFKAHYHQEPDPTNSLLNICGYGGLVRFKKAMHPAWFTQRESGENYE